MSNSREKDYIACLTRATNNEMSIICEDIMDLEETSETITEVERGSLYDLTK